MLIIFLTVFLGTASLHVSSKYSLYFSKNVEKLVGLEAHIILRNIGRCLKCKTELWCTLTLFYSEIKVDRAMSLPEDINLTWTSVACVSTRSDLFRGMDSLSAQCIIELDVASVTVSSLSSLRRRSCSCLLTVRLPSNDCLSRVLRQAGSWTSRASSGWLPDYLVRIARLTRYINGRMPYASILRIARYPSAARAHYWLIFILNSSGSYAACLEHLILLISIDFNYIC